MRTAHKLAACLAIALAAASAATAAPPREGILAPGRSLGGVRLGLTPAQVRAHWGSSYGVCRDCARTTWYFTYKPFTQKGAGVEFRRGRVSAVFTLWAPKGWRSTKGLRIDEPEASVTDLYGALPRTECGTYSALLQRRRGVRTAFYVVSGRVWGFAILSPGAVACR